MDSAQPVSGTLKNNLKQKKVLQHTARLSNKHVSDEGIFFFSQGKVNKEGQTDSRGEENRVVSGSTSWATGA